MGGLFYDPGVFAHRMKLQSPQETSDGCGGVSVSWTDIQEVWASIELVNSKRDFEASQLSERNIHRVKIRFRTDVASGWRFAFDNRLFDIVSVVDPDESRRYLHCETNEVGR